MQFVYSCVVQFWRDCCIEGASAVIILKCKFFFWSLWCDANYFYVKAARVWWPTYVCFSWIDQSIGEDLLYLYKKPNALRYEPRIVTSRLMVSKSFLESMPSVLSLTFDVYFLLWRGNDLFFIKCPRLWQPYTFHSLLLLLFIINCKWGYTWWQWYYNDTKKKQINTHHTN
jgi:hypothetical protein